MKKADSNVARVRAALLRRSKAGLKKYGVSTDRPDLSLLDWLNHLQEELLDAAVYIEAAKTQIKAGANKWDAVKRIPTHKR